MWFKNIRNLITSAIFNHHPKRPNYLLPAYRQAGGHAGFIYIYFLNNHGILSYSQIPKVNQLPHSNFQLAE